MITLGVRRPPGSSRAGETPVQFVNPQAVRGLILSVYGVPALLNERGECSVHAIRPMICRLWGLTKSMACPFGCVPERWLTEDEAHALLAKAEEW